MLPIHHLVCLLGKTQRQEAIEVLAHHKFLDWSKNGGQPILIMLWLQRPNVLQLKRYEVTYDHLCYRDDMTGGLWPKAALRFRIILID